MRRRPPPPVNLTAERARRGRCPWSMTVDVAADRIRVTISEGATAVDAEAMAAAAEAWGNTLLGFAEDLRRSLRKTRRTRQ